MINPVRPMSMRLGALLIIILLWACDSTAPIPTGTTTTTIDAPVNAAPDLGTPIILVTDLSHPGGDPDDHIDITVTAGLDLNVVGLVLERTDGSGIAPAKQLEAIANTEWPTVVGHDGADLILKVLAASPVPVAIVSVGSLREIAMAWRQNPELMRSKVQRLVVFAGDAADLVNVEYNVGLDPSAFTTVMGSGLPIRWVPCFDGGAWQAGTRSSFIRTEQANLFPTLLPDPIERFLSYRLSGATSDPLAWVAQPVTPADRRVLSDGYRNVWAAGLIADSIGDGIVTWNGTDVGSFEPTTVRFNDAGQVDPDGPIVANVERWTVHDPTGWREAMITLTIEAMTAVD